MVLRQEAPPQVVPLRGCGGNGSGGSFPVQPSMEAVPDECKPTKGSRFGQDGILCRFFREETSRYKISDFKQVRAAKKIDFSYSGFIGNTLESNHLIWKDRKEGGSELQDRVVE